MNIKPIYWLKLCILSQIRNQRVKKKKQEKEIFLKNFHHFFAGREKTLDSFESKIFLTKSKGTGILNSDHSKLKVLTPKQMPQSLPIAVAQVKAGNNSESLLNEIRHFFFVSIEINH